MGILRNVFTSRISSRFLLTALWIIHFYPLTLPVRKGVGMTPQWFFENNSAQNEPKLAKILLTSSLIDKKWAESYKSPVVLKMWGRERLKVEKSVRKWSQNAFFANFPLKFL